MLDFSSSIGFVPCPKAGLLDFATRIFDQAESAGRICTSWRFVSLLPDWRNARQPHGLYL
jgi:hypothetical protein